MAPETKRLLRAIAVCRHDNVLEDVYNIERGNESTLDQAVYAWLDAGRPDDPGARKRTGKRVPRG